MVCSRPSTHRDSHRGSSARSVVCLALALLCSPALAASIPRLQHNQQQHPTTVAEALGHIEENRSLAASTSSTSFLPSSTSSLPGSGTTGFGTFAPSFAPTSTPGVAPSNAPSSSPTVAVPAAGNYQIELVNIGKPNAKYDKYMARAKQRWEQVIIGDVPDVKGITIDQALGGAFRLPLNVANQLVDVDDIVILYEFAKIDGGGTPAAGNTLGSTTVTQFRSAAQGGAPLSAYMVFDSNDVETFIREGTFAAVALHEMGHALGFGSFDQFASKCGTSCKVYDKGVPGGCMASDKFTELGLPGQLLVQYIGKEGDGSYCSHWFEGQLGDELMTPYASQFLNPLTAISIGAFADMGYEVSYDSADPIDEIMPTTADIKASGTNRLLQQRREASRRMAEQAPSRIAIDAPLRQP